MIIVRPIKKSDLKALHQIAIDSGHGFTSVSYTHLTLPTTPYV